MDSINSKYEADAFPFDTLRKLQQPGSPETTRNTTYSAQSYDNRSRIFSDTFGDTAENALTSYASMALNRINKKNVSEDTSLSGIGLTLNNDGTLEIGDDFTQALQGRLDDVYKALGGKNGFFTQVASGLDAVQERGENDFIYAKNSVLAYDADGSTRRSVYQSGSTDIINLFT